MSAPEIRVQQSIAAVLRLVHQVAVPRARVMLPATDHDPPTMVTLEPHGPLLIERPEGTVEVPHEQLPHGSEPDVPMPDTPELGPYPPFEVALDGTVSGMLGSLSGLADALRRIAAAIGPDTVVGCDLRTVAGAPPLSVVARAGEPAVALIGDDPFEIPE